MFEQHFQGLARGNPGDVQGFAETSFRRQGLFGFPLPGVDGLFQIARQLKVKRGGQGVVGAQGGQRGHGGDFRWRVVLKI
ncbi:hypothetical protein D3C84_1013760 [compost metagenome]